MLWYYQQTVVFQRHYEWLDQQLQLTHVDYSAQQLFTGRAKTLLCQSVMEWWSPCYCRNELWCSRVLVKRSSSHLNTSEYHSARPTPSKSVSPAIKELSPISSSPTIKIRVTFEEITHIGIPLKMSIVFRSGKPSPRVERSLAPGLLNYGPLFWLQVKHHLSFQ